MNTTTPCAIVIKPNPPSGECNFERTFVETSCLISRQKLTPVCLADTECRFNVTKVPKSIPSNLSIASNNLTDFWSGLHSGTIKNADVPEALLNYTKAYDVALECIWNITVMPGWKVSVDKRPYAPRIAQQTNPNSNPIDLPDFFQLRAKQAKRLRFKFYRNLRGTFDRGKPDGQVLRNQNGAAIVQVKRV